MVVDPIIIHGQTLSVFLQGVHIRNSRKQSESFGGVEGEEHKEEYTDREEIDSHHVPVAIIHVSRFSSTVAPSLPTNLNTVLEYCGSHRDNSACLRSSMLNKVVTAELIEQYVASTLTWTNSPFANQQYSTS